MDVGFLDHSRESLPKGAPRLQEGGELGALPELWDRQLDAARPCLPGPLPIAIAVGTASGAACAQGGSRLDLHLQVHHALGRKSQKFAHEVRIQPSSISSIRAILSSVIVVSCSRLSSQLNPSRRPAMIT